MKSIGGYVMALVGVIILATLSGIFLNDKKIGKFLNYVFSSLIILMAITPIASIINGGLKNEASLFDYKIDVDREYLQYLDDIKNNEMNSAVEKMLAKNGYKNVKIKISSGENSQFIKTVWVNLDNLVIDAEFEHIDKYRQITSLIADYLDIAEEAVFYE